MSIDVYRNENNFNTAMCSDTWSINASEARGFSKSNANCLAFKQLDLHNEGVSSVCIKRQGTEQTNVKFRRPNVNRVLALRSMAGSP